MPSEDATIQPADTIATAILNGHFPQVRFLLELGRSVNERLPDGRTPLILCSYIRDHQWTISLARTLIEKGGLIGLRDKCGLNALHWACVYQCPHLVELYLKAVDYDFQQTDKLGNSALHFAARSGNMEVLNMLISVLSKFNFPMDKANREGTTALMMAWQADQIEAAETLLAAGADSSCTDLYGRSASQLEKAARLRRQHCDEVTDAKRAAAQLRFDDVDGWNRQKERARSACNPPSSTKGLSWSNIYKQRTRPSLPTRCEDQLISTASKLDARSHPETVFRTSPAEFFERVHDRRVSESRPPSAPALQGTQPTSWRVQMGHLFQEYQFQCSPSYRTTIIPPPRDSSSPFFGSTSYDNSEYSGLMRGGMHRRGSVVSVRTGRRRLDRKVSNSPMRLYSTDTSAGGDDASYSPAPSRLSKRRPDATGLKLGRSASRGGGTSVTSRDSLGSST